MSFLQRLLNCFNAEGIRESIRDSYAKHYRLATRGSTPVPSGTAPHEAGLYGALCTRYMVRGTPRPELLLWAELAPFLAMPESTALEALAEYTVYQELPTDAKTEWLGESINLALRNAAATPDESPATMATMGLINHAEWSALLDAENLRVLTELGNRIVSGVEQASPRKPSLET